MQTNAGEVRKTDTKNDRKQWDYKSQKMRQGFAKQNKSKQTYNLRQMGESVAAVLQFRFFVCYFHYCQLFQFQGLSSLKYIVFIKCIEFPVSLLTTIMKQDIGSEVSSEFQGLYRHLQFYMMVSWQRKRPSLPRGILFVLSLR